MPTTVSIVEDHLPTREGLSELINQSVDFDCVSCHTTGEDAIDKLPRVKPEIVLVDIDLPGMSGVDAIRKLKVLLPQTQFIISAPYKDNDAIFTALLAGANGFLLKQTPPRELLTVLREICAGGTPMSSLMARKIVEAFRGSQASEDESKDLTIREQEVLELLTQGCLYKEIADTLQISYRTVSTHLEHIYGKLHVHSRTQAVAKHLRQTKSVRI